MSLDLGKWGHLVRNHVERNLACILAGNTPERRANIQQTPSPAARRLDGALLTWLERHPRRAAKWIGMDIPPGMRFVGAGSENTVIRVGEDVLKIHRASADRDAAARDAMADQHNELHTVLRSYLGETVLQQRTDVASHPFRRGVRVVISHQPWIVFEPLSFFPAHLPSIDSARLHHEMNDRPFLAAALHELASRGLLMHAETGLLLDTSGADNLVVVHTDTGPELKCLDGLPIHTGKPHDTARILGQLRHLQELTNAT